MDGSVETVQRRTSRERGRWRGDGALAPTGADAQPVSQVIWVDRERLQANGWNPNRVPPPELRLLKLSILENGWTQPIVVFAIDPDQPDTTPFEVIDGFHRWTVSGDKAIFALTAGLVPTVQLRGSVEERMLATVRHNRARGNHYVLKMADIVRDLLASGMSDEEVGRRLQMDGEEVLRLKQRGDMLVRAADAAGGFNNGWQPGVREKDVSD